MARGRGRQAAAPDAPNQDEVRDTERGTSETAPPTEGAPGDHAPAEETAPDAPQQHHGAGGDEANHDPLRNRIAGARQLVEHLRASGTGGSKLQPADQLIKQMGDRLCGSDLKPDGVSAKSMRIGAEVLIEAMTLGDHPVWPDETVSKARAFVSSQAFA